MAARYCRKVLNSIFFIIRKFIIISL